MKANNLKFFEKFPWSVKVTDLPAPIKFRHLFGPGVIMLATALGSGEIYFWPGIAMQSGFEIVLIAILAIYIQYILNTEFARYTITTGETIITGFIRYWKPLGWLFLACSTLPWIWPGWTTGGAQAYTWVFGGNVDLVSIASLVIIGLSLSITKVVYKALEFFQKILIFGVLILLILIGVLVIKMDSITALGDGLTSIPTALPSGITIATLLSALAFCGAGGSINLATSNWIRDKGIGMGKYVPKIKNPVTQETFSKNNSGFYPADNEENRTAWAKWWALIQKEQFFSFFIIGLFSLILLMLISHSLLFEKGLPIGIDMLVTEGQEIEIASNSLIKSSLFYLVVAAVFFTSSIGVLDHVCRIVADIISTYNCNKKGILSNESKLYFIALWSMIAIGIIIILFFKDNSPKQLLTIAGSLSGIVMFLYSTLILLMNVKLEKQVTYSSGFNPFAMGAWRKLIVILGIILYGFFTFSLISEILT